MSSVVSSEPSLVESAANEIATRQGATQAASAQTARIEFISFSIGDDQYGVEITAVREIKGWTSITHLPKQPDYVRGVLNLRGVMVPIIDLRCRFGQGVTDATSMHVVIVVQIDGKLVGILADRVLDIVSFDAAQIQRVPHVTRDIQSELLAGLVTIESGMIALIDLQHLVASDDGVETLSKVAAAA